MNFVGLDNLDIVRHLGWLEAPPASDVCSVWCVAFPLPEVVNGIRMLRETPRQDRDSSCVQQPYVCLRWRSPTVFAHTQDIKQRLMHCRNNISLSLSQSLRARHVPIVQALVTNLTSRSFLVANPPEPVILRGSIPGDTAAKLPNCLPSRFFHSF
ncbi:hypothetical protein LZ32DRAFT_428013 [Colletotrichum eremochloae]|nr:hypothetical protein LZ32DRAFT_428013 [Colletotrichum eremochloae]